MIVLSIDKGDIEALKGNFYNSTRKALYNASLKIGSDANWLGLTLRREITEQMKRNLPKSHDANYKIRKADYLVDYEERAGYEKNIAFATFNYKYHFPETFDDNGEKIEYGYALADKNTILGGEVQRIANWIMAKTRLGTGKFWYRYSVEGKSKKLTVTTNKEAMRAAFAMVKAGNAIKNPAINWYAVDLNDKKIVDKMKILERIYEQIVFEELKK